MTVDKERDGWKEEIKHSSLIRGGEIKRGGKKSPTNERNADISSSPICRTIVRN